MNRNALEYYQNIYPLIKNFCLPLNDYFSLPLFVYVKVYKNGKYLLITNDNKLQQDYLNNVKYSNIFFDDYLTCKGTYDSIIWPSNPQNECMQTYFDHGYWHGITFITNKSEQFVEATCFLGDKNNPRIMDLYYKHSLILEKVSNHFKKTFVDKINIPHNSPKLATFSNGFDMYIPDKRISQKQEMIHSFYESMGLPNNYIETENFAKLAPKEKNF
jgi:hypothetical protein